MANPFLYTCAPTCHCIPDGYDPISPFASSCPLDIEDRTFLEDFTAFEKNLFGSYEQVGDNKGIKENVFFPFPNECQPFPLVAALLDDEVCDLPESISDDEVCAFIYLSDDCDEGTKYRLKTFMNQDEAEDKGGVVTHEGRCGACSSAQDLVMNMNPAIGLIAFGCGVQNVVQVLPPPPAQPTPEQVQDALDNTITCIQDQLTVQSQVEFGIPLTFSDECAFVWASNTLNSVFAGCTTDCLAYLGPCLGDPFSALCNAALAFGAYDDLILNSCDLNACLECDETESGPIFKVFSGRTRRNSGILTSFEMTGVFGGLKRDCDSIANIAQDPCERN